MADDTFPQLTSVTASAVLEAHASPLAVLDQALNVRYLNQRWRELTDALEPGQPFVQRYASAQQLNNDQQQELLRVLEVARTEAGEPQIFEHQGWTVDRERWLLLTCTAMPSDAKPGLLVERRDISLRRASIRAAEQHAAELDALLTLGIELTSHHDLQSVLNLIVVRSCEILPMLHDLHIFLAQGDELVFGAAIWGGQLQEQPISIPRPGGLTYTTFKTGEPFIVADMQSHPLYANAPQEWIGAIIGMPLKIRQRVVAVMNFTYPKTYSFTDSNMRLMRLLAEQAAIAIENAQLHEQAQRDLREREESQARQARLQQEIIDIQGRMLAEVSTPLLPISDEVVVLPLVGSVDADRAQKVLETLLEGITTYRAQTAILDITGVPIVDTHVANTLIGAARAVQLLGAEVLLTGIRPEVAQALVGLGVDLGAMRTLSSLQSGIAYAFQRRR